MEEVTTREKKALKEFCLASIEQKRVAEETKQQKKAETAAAKVAKEELDEWLRKQGSRCFAIPKARYKEIEQQLSAKGLPPLPAYVRLKKQTSDSTISPNAVEECIQELTWESVEAAASSGSTPLERIAHAITETLRKNIRTCRESVQMSESLEKGTKALEVPDIQDEEAIQSMLKLHVAQHQAKAIGQATKAQETQAKEELKKLEAVVDKVLTKTNRTAQPIALEGTEGVHKIVKKTSARASKLTLGAFQEFVTESLDQLNLGETDKEAWAVIQRERATLTKLILLKINSMPKKEETKIKLVTRAQPEMEVEENEKV